MEIQLAENLVCPRINDVIIKITKNNKKPISISRVKFLSSCFNKGHIFWEVISDKNEHISILLINDGSYLFKFTQEFDVEVWLGSDSLIELEDSFGDKVFLSLYDMNFKSCIPIYITYVKEFGYVKGAEIYLKTKYNLSEPSPDYGDLEWPKSRFEEWDEIVL